jgi:ankyrin repeat protein
MTHYNLIAAGRRRYATAVQKGRRLVAWLLCLVSSTLLLSCGKGDGPNMLAVCFVQPAIDQGNVGRVKLLLRLGVDVNANVLSRHGLNKRSLLGYATEQDQPAMVALLLARGAAVNQVNDHTSTALCLAKSPEVFKLLMTHGARFLPLSFSKGTQEWTYPTTYLRHRPTVAPLVLDYAPDSLFRQYDFYEPLLLGFIDRDDTVRVRQLLRRGASLVKPTRANVEYKVLVHNQPLYYSRSPEMTWLLARNGAVTSHVSNDPIDDYNLLAMAIAYGDVRLLHYAEQLGQPLRTPNNSFFLAAHDSAMVRYLLGRGVSINSRSSYGSTALLRAAFDTHDACLESLLLQLGANKTLANQGGDSYARGYNPRTGNRPIAPADTISAYTCVAQMPTLPGGGGTPAIQAFVQRALAPRLPAGVRNGQLKGRAHVQLTVGPSGVVRNEEVQTVDDPACDAALLAAVRQLPRLVPGRHQGRPVSVQLWLQLNLAAQ